MIRITEEERMVEEIRVELLRVRQERGLTYQDLASRIKKPSGERYSTDSVMRFLTQDRPARNWTNFAMAAIRGWDLGSVEIRVHSGRSKSRRPF